MILIIFYLNIKAILKKIQIIIYLNQSLFFAARLYNFSTLILFLASIYLEFYD
jgi:hypothetical protein